MSTFFDLFTSTGGLLTVFIILFMLVMTGYFAYMFITKMKSEGEEYDRTHPNES